MAFYNPNERRALDHCDNDRACSFGKVVYGYDGVAGTSPQQSILVVIARPARCGED